MMIVAAADVSELTPEELKEAAKLAGRLYAARRAIVDSVCAYPPCGRTITGTTRKRYCSPSHRVMDARRRKREGPVL